MSPHKSNVRTKVSVDKYRFCMYVPNDRNNLEFSFCPATVTNSLDLCTAEQLFHSLSKSARVVLKFYESAPICAAEKSIRWSTARHAQESPLEVHPSNSLINQKSRIDDTTLRCCQDLNVSSIDATELSA
jgi:hypothetical protein